MSPPFCRSRRPDEPRKMVMRAFFAGRSIRMRDTAAFFSFGLQELAHFDVFGQHAGEVAVALRTNGCPVAANSQAEAGRMDFLSHILPRPFSCQLSRTRGTWACLMRGLPRLPFARAVKRLSVVPLFDEDGLDLQFVDVGAVVVLGVGDSGLSTFLMITAAFSA